jgi:hypothetical protein
MQATSQPNFKEILVNGRIYTSQRLRPSVSIPLATRLAKILGPGLAKAIPDGELKSKKVNVGAIFEGLAPTLDEQLVFKFITDLLSPAAYQNVMLKDRSFDDHFTNYPEDIFPLVRECIQYQFGSFFKGLLQGPSTQVQADEEA